jgi:cytochrome P450
MSIVEWVLKNPFNVVLGVIVGLVSVTTISIYSFYQKRRHLPPGPFPLPVIGTVYLFLKRDQHLFLKMFGLEKEYGPVFTLWAGKMPQVIVTDPKISMELLKKHQFAGRPQVREMMEVFLSEEDKRASFTDVASSDFNHEWEVLRKVTHAALRKYAVSEKLPLLVSDVVDEVYEEMVRKEGSGAFDVNKYLYLIMYSIISTSAFGKRYALDDPEMNQWISNMEAQSKLTGSLILIFLVPASRFILRSAFKQIRNNFVFQKRFTQERFQEHLESFDGENIRDFCDALLLSRKEAEKEVRGNSEYLHDRNLMNSVLLLFSAGSETSRITLLWAVLFIANDYGIQEKLREEIEKVIGNTDIPTLLHKKDCHFTEAFINEVMRSRPIAPLGVSHKVMVDTEINGHPIKEGTTINFSLWHCLQDKESWGDPENFRVERFLNDDRKFVSKPNGVFLPFSAGRRSCPGDKLALNDMFFILARLVQRTQGMRIELENGPGSIDLKGDPKKTGGFLPHDFKIKLVKV